MPLVIRSRRGAPSKIIVERLRAFRPQQDDLTAMAVLLQSRTLQRTERGSDRNGAPFAPYSDVGPVYIDIGAKSGKRTRKQKVEAAQRFARGVGLSGRILAKPRKTATQRAASRVAALKNPARLRRINPDRKKGDVTPIGSITPGGYLKAASYRSFKLDILGRAAVDLFGHRAPHMLQQLVVKLQGSGATVRPRPSSSRQRSQARIRPVLVGFFGEVVGQALAHAEGRGNLPRRDFFGLGRGDAKALIGELRRRVRIRQSRF